MHNSQQFSEVLDGENEGDQIWADSAYRSQALEAALPELGYDSQIHERAYRNHPLTEAQKETNRGKSKIRSKVEHIFGIYVTCMGGKLVCCIGIEQVRATLGLKDLAYNLRRYVFWQKQAEQGLGGSVPKGRERGPQEACRCSNRGELSMQLRFSR